MNRENLDGARPGAVEGPRPSRAPRRRIAEVEADLVSRGFDRRTVRFAISDAIARGELTQDGDSVTPGPNARLLRAARSPSRRPGAGAQP